MEDDQDTKENVHIRLQGHYIVGEKDKEDLEKSDDHDDRLTEVKEFVVEKREYGSEAVFFML